MLRALLRGVLRIVLVLAVVLAMSWVSLNMPLETLGQIRPYLQAPWLFIAPILAALLPVFLLPSYLVLIPLFWLIDSVAGLFGFGPFNFFRHEPVWWSYALVGIMFVISWAGWVTIFSRTAKLIGLWNPFSGSYLAKRRVFLQGLIRLRDWWESKREFGKGPSSKWASLLEVISHRYVGGDIFLGRPKLPIGGMLRPVGLPTERHFVTIAGTGSGKSTAALIPNICIHEGSLLCVDPKGELATITAERRGHGGNGIEGLGQDVYVLDPFGVVDLEGETACYNVFDEMERVAAGDPDRPVSYAGKIAEALVKPLSQKDAYWDSAAKTLIRGLVLYIFVHERPERKSLVRLRELIMEGHVELYEEGIELGAFKRNQLTPYAVLLERMRSVRDGPYGEAIASAAGSILAMGREQEGGVITSAQEHTAFLEAPELKRVCMRSDFLLEDLKTDRISVYLCLPLNMVSAKEGHWLRMFVMLFIDMMMRKKEPPDAPVLFCIDEFPSLGRLENIELVAPAMRSYGVRFWAIAQDIEQLKNVYPGVWGGFLGNAEAVQFMGIKHAETVDFIVKLLGRHEVPEVDGAGNYRRIVKKDRPLLDADQVGRLVAPENKTQIVWRGHHRPMLLKIAPYFEYLPWYYYSPDRSHREPLRKRFWRWRAA